MGTEKKYIFYFFFVKEVISLKYNLSKVSTFTIGGDDHVTLIGDARAGMVHRN